MGGGLPNLLQYYKGGEGSSETPKSYYVIYGRPLINKGRPNFVFVFVFVFVFEVSLGLCPPASPSQKTSTLCMHNICTTSQRSLPSLTCVPASLFNIQLVFSTLISTRKRKPLKSQNFPKTVDIFVTLQ